MLFFFLQLIASVFPIRSMYGIFTYIYHGNQPNVVKYAIHGWYGFGEDYFFQMFVQKHVFQDLCWPKPPICLAVFLVGNRGNGVFKGSWCCLSCEVTRMYNWNTKQQNWEANHPRPHETSPKNHPFFFHGEITAYQHNRKKRVWNGSPI